MKFIDIDNSMATSVKGEIKLEGSADTGSQINAINNVTAGGFGQILVVQQTSVVGTYIYSVGTSLN